MRLGLMTGYWGSGPPAGVVEQIRTAEELGFDSVWTSEAYGSDALTPLAWWGAATQRVRLGTAIVQMSARTATATAMAAMTLDHLSGGRFILGLGVSGPQVVEGWYGQPFPRPLQRTREYVDVIRQVLRREAPVTLDGAQIQLPLRGGAGLGKALKPTVHPLRADLPIFLAAEGPRNVALAAEIADGWIPFWFSPASDASYREHLAAGFAVGGRDPDRFEVACPVPVSIDDDVERAADRVRPALALYVGGMGARDANFHYEVFARMGYEAECERIQSLYLEGRKEEATASIPLRMVEDVALVGPADKVADDLDRWRGTVITTLLVSGPPPVLRQVAELVG